MEPDRRTGEEPDAAKRQADGRFGVGNRANPAGRPKDLARFREKCQAKSELLLTKLCTIALSGQGLASVRAAELVLAYAWGKPNQPITGDGGKDLIPSRDDAIAALRSALPGMSDKQLETNTSDLTADSIAVLASEAERDAADRDAEE